jgi:hypothetical protein
VADCAGSLARGNLVQSRAVASLSPIAAFGSASARITLRRATMGDVTKQLRRMTEEVLPIVATGVAAATAAGVS